MDTLWEKLPEPLPDERREGETLLNEYLAKGAIARTVTEMVRLPAGSMVHFYRQLARLRSAESPVGARADSSWMAGEADFCFINVRATGVGDQPGNFVQAAKLLPAIRTRAIHLGPFTDYDFHVIYAVRSVRTISPRVVDPQLALSAEDQLRAFVQAAHLLGKTVGFDIEPHVAQFAIPVVLRPELFRWFKLSPDKTGLAGGLSEAEMLAEPQQQRITAEIRALVGEVLEKEQLGDLEAAEGEPQEVRARKQVVYGDLIGRLIERGYWPIPSQSWAGRGTPGFGGYSFDGNYARFLYRGEDGADLSASAYHILTPFKFYSGLLPNRRPDAAELFRPAVDYFGDIFSYWRDEFGFDFVRYDSADHIFDSVTEAGLPSADRPTPFVLQTCVERVKAPDKPYIGNFAERMGDEIEAYAALGFDLVLGHDMLHRVDAALLEHSFGVYDRLKALNGARLRPASIAFCVDTHDTGNPGLWGEPLVKAAGAAQMRLRHFLARFISAGAGRRPKYEVMGSQDLSYGLYQANVSEANLVWVGDESYNRHYHYLEDVYEHYRSVLRQGEITHRHAEPGYAWWLITDGRCWLVPVIAFTRIEARQIELPGLPAGKSVVKEYDFVQLCETERVLAGPRIELPALPAESARLFVSL